MASERFMRHHYGASGFIEEAPRSYPISAESLTALLTAGNHLASSLLRAGGFPNDYLSYLDALHAKGQPYADMWIAWSAIKDIRDEMNERRPIVTQ